MGYACQSSLFSYFNSRRRNTPYTTNTFRGEGSSAETECYGKHKSFCRFSFFGSKCRRCKGTFCYRRGNGGGESSPGCYSYPLPGFAVSSLVSFLIFAAFRSSLIFFVLSGKWHATERTLCLLQRFLSCANAHKKKTRRSTLKIASRVCVRHRTMLFPAIFIILSGIIKLPNLIGPPVVLCVCENIFFKGSLV